MLPIALLAVLALRRGVSEGFDTFTPLQVVPKDQFVPAMLGFLSFRVPLLFQARTRAATSARASERASETHIILYYTEINHRVCIHMIHLDTLLGERERVKKIRIIYRSIM